jgi:serine/threonine protein kinase
VRRDILSILLRAHDDSVDDELDGFHALIRRMLEWDPSKRPTAADALAHHAWDKIRMAEDRIKRPAPEDAEGSARTTKKARARSPDNDASTSVYVSEEGSGGEESD